MRIKAFAAFGCRRDGYLSIVAIQELFESCIAAADGRVFLSRASQSVRHTWVSDYNSRLAFTQ
jgi:hypothetical protein